MIQYWFPSPSSQMTQITLKRSEQALLLTTVGISYMKYYTDHTLSEIKATYWTMPDYKNSNCCIILLKKKKNILLHYFLLCFSNFHYHHLEVTKFGRNVMNSICKWPLIKDQGEANEYKLLSILELCSTNWINFHWFPSTDPDEFRKRHQEKKKKKNKSSTGQATTY